jgi:hypothetical protein
MYKNTSKLKEFNKNYFSENQHKISAFSGNSNVSASGQNLCNKTQNAKKRAQRTRISGHNLGSRFDLINAVIANEIF